jgi:glucose-6-phosphate-specific signal transduction histidine kinase
MSNIKWNKKYDMQLFIVGIIAGIGITIIITSDNNGNLALGILIATMFIGIGIYLIMNRQKALNEELEDQINEMRKLIYEKMSEEERQKLLEEIYNNSINKLN